MKDCVVCEGTGNRWYYQFVTMACKEKNRIYYPCPICNGTGKVPKNVEVSISHGIWIRTEIKEIR